jgi:hypothetical protein
VIQKSILPSHYNYTCKPVLYWFYNWSFRTLAFHFEHQTILITDLKYLSQFDFIVHSTGFSDEIKTQKIWKVVYLYVTVLLILKLGFVYSVQYHCWPLRHVPWPSPRLGAPGVEWSAELRSDVSVNQLFFLPEQVTTHFISFQETFSTWEKLSLFAHICKTCTSLFNNEAQYIICSVIHN